jgi:hypothetical protein
MAFSYLIIPPPNIPIACLVDGPKKKTTHQSLLPKLAVRANEMYIYINRIKKLVNVSNMYFPIEVIKRKK